jgi:class 3 adenylate cyclase
VIGNPVNTAARLMEAAQMGEMLVSSDFYEEIRRLVPQDRVESRGEVALRGKAEAVRVYSIRP